MSPRPRLRCVPETTSLTLKISHGADAAGLRAELRCAQCGRPLQPPEGIYVLRLMSGLRRGSLTGRIERVGGGSWSFTSGEALADLVSSLGHTHRSEEDE